MKRNKYKSSYLPHNRGLDNNQYASKNEVAVKYVTQDLPDVLNTNKIPKILESVGFEVGKIYFNVTLSGDKPDLYQGEIVIQNGRYKYIIDARTGLAKNSVVLIKHKRKGVPEGTHWFIEDCFEVGGLRIIERYTPNLFNALLFFQNQLLLLGATKFDREFIFAINYLKDSILEVCSGKVKLNL